VVGDMKMKVENVMMRIILVAVVVVVVVVMIEIGIVVVHLDEIMIQIVQTNIILQKKVRNQKSFTSVVIVYPLDNERGNNRNRNHDTHESNDQGRSSNNNNNSFNFESKPRNAQR
jgi:hypothetical protein